MIGKCLTTELCISSWSFETVSHSVPRLTLKLKCSCYHLPNAGITSVRYYNTQFYNNLFFLMAVLGIELITC